MATITDQMIADALLASGGLLSNAAKHLSERLGRPISRAAVSKQVEASRVLSVVRQIAEERGWAGAIEAARRIKKQHRKARNKALWAERAHWVEDIRGDPWQAAKLANGAGDPETLERDGHPNARAHARGSSGLMAARVQTARYRRLCGARTRKGTPCVRRVVPGMGRCPSHGGKSTGPKTAEGKARIAAAQQARWERFRQEERRAVTDARKRGSSVADCCPSPG
jgi:hypothetical protein